VAWKCNPWDLGKIAQPFGTISRASVQLNRSADHQDDHFKLATFSSQTWDNGSKSILVELGMFSTSISCQITKLFRSVRQHMIKHDCVPMHDQTILRSLQVDHGQPNLITQHNIWCKKYIGIVMYDNGVKSTVWFKVNFDLYLCHSNSSNNIIIT
jgi:hypothetical protein